MEFAELANGADVEEMEAMTKNVVKWTNESEDRQRLYLSSSSRAGVTPVVEREG